MLLHTSICALSSISVFLHSHSLSLSISFSDSFSLPPRTRPPSCVFFMHRFLLFFCSSLHSRARIQVRSLDDASQLSDANDVAAGCASLRRLLSAVGSRWNSCISWVSLYAARCASVRYFLQWKSRPAKPNSSLILCIARPMTQILWRLAGSWRSWITCLTGSCPWRRCPSLISFEPLM